MKSFDIPEFYRSPMISEIKNRRKSEDKLKKDFSPSMLSFPGLEVYLARHFGFCYGVENAIEIAFRTVYENPNRRIFLLSEMIHNPLVNADLIQSGVQFIMDTQGNKYISWNELTSDDIVIIPAFGTTLETEEQLKQIGIDPLRYNTTCPFVEKVWNRSAQIGDKGYTIIVHGKPKHEETRATFSHSSTSAPTVVVKDMEETIALAAYIRGEKSKEEFYVEFEGQFSTGFDPLLHLNRIGVVNQTTMLASDTQAIADYLKNMMMQHYQVKAEEVHLHFADTRDTLCYATNDNQTAVVGLLETPADLAIVVGGYNSSNTSHLVELCEQQLPTYYIENESCISDEGSIQHFDLHSLTVKTTASFLPHQEVLKVLMTSGASCPDAVVERVIQRLNQVNQKLRAQ
jgi:4-hydroxy-3-methylbut-2-enyl diphosphate reductase